MSTTVDDPDGIAAAAAASTGLHSTNAMNGTGSGTVGVSEMEQVVQAQSIAMPVVCPISSPAAGPFAYPASPEVKEHAYLPEVKDQADMKGPGGWVFLPVSSRPATPPEGMPSMPSMPVPQVSLPSSARL
ncbi:hypothetical protein BGZ96_009353 [Linnemannia gamsii]|uniref:Uncharacterized protein n=1 Tax=Linnemannia gamsii TaxID=64522 RepID=A0ABQ7JWQ1_9FUNG|nr:hypothetical protein BGZ96_009353 [Linnemannia gamsii]